ncbi:MAG: hypothetical protein AAFS10_11045, partial [Myxococcota bacterium]
NMTYRLGFATAGDRHVTKDRSGRLDAVEPNDFGLLFRKVFPEASREMRGSILARTSRPVAQPRPPAPIHGQASPEELRRETLGGHHDPLKGSDPMRVSHPAPRGGPRERRTPSAPIEARPRSVPPHTSRPLEPTPTPSPTPPTPAAASPPRRPLAEPVRPMRSTPTRHIAVSSGPLVLEGAYGTEAWHHAMERFRQVLKTLSQGDRGRIDAICDFVKRTQDVASSTEMSARALHAWAERLEFMAASGDLDEYL